MKDNNELENLGKEHSELVDKYKECFSSPAGEIVLNDLIVAYGDRTSFSSDPYGTAFKEGQRSVLLRIRAMIKERKE
jgi:hypothetical protein